jgi:hypothetical protein
MGHAWVNVTYMDDADFEAAVAKREQVLESRATDASDGQ